MNSRSSAHVFLFEGVWCNYCHPDPWRVWQGFRATIDDTGSGSSAGSGGSGGSGACPKPAVLPSKTFTSHREAQGGLGCSGENFGGLEMLSESCGKLYIKKLPIRSPCGRAVMFDFALVDGGFHFPNVEKPRFS